MQITDHAERRFAQRGLRLSDIETVMKFGCKIHKTGVIFYTFRRRDIPKGVENRKHFERLEGATILVSPDEGTIITAYKNRESFSQIKKKSKQAGKNLRIGGLSCGRFPGMGEDLFPRPLVKPVEILSLPSRVQNS